MSSDNIYSSASSLNSDGRKRKDLVHAAATATAYKRFRRDCSLLFGSSSSPSRAAGQSRSADLDSGPDVSVSCVEDAPTPRHSCVCSSGLRSEGASWDAGSSGSFLDSSASGWTSTRSWTPATTTASTEVTSSELQESEASFHPVVLGESAKMARAGSGTSPLSSKRRKFLSTSLDDSWLECATTPRRLEKGPGPPPATKAANVEVKVAAATCNQDDQTAPAPVYVLSSGRKSRPPGTPFSGLHICPGDG